MFRSVYILWLFLLLFFYYIVWKQAVRLPILAIVKQTMTLEIQQVYKIDNKTPKVEKNLFARVNRFDQPIKTWPWDKMFLKLFWTKVQGRGTNFKKYKTDEILHLSNFFELKRTLVYMYLKFTVFKRTLVSMSYFTNIAVQNVNKGFV
jgi:hypothetical protein